MITDTEHLSPTEKAPLGLQLESSAPRDRWSLNLIRAGTFSLVATGLISLYPPLGTALFGPPVYPFALLFFLFVTLCAAALTGLRWSELASSPERWPLPLAAAVGIALLASPFSDRAAFPALALLLLPAGILVITALIDTSADRGARCLNVFRATAAVAICVAIWGLFSWAVVDFGTQAGAVDRMMQITGLDTVTPGLFSFANEHPFGHKNFVAGFVLLTLPLLLALVCVDQSRARLLWLAGLPILFFYLASAESRAGWLALAIGAACYLALWCVRARAAKLSWWAIPVLLVVLTIPFLASPRLRDSVQRVGQEESLAAIDPYRWEMFQIGIAVGNERMLTGVGPGALSLVSPEHSSVSANYPVVYQVHSTPFQLYAEVGFLGILGSLVLGWGLFWSWKRNRKESPPLERHLRDAAAVALLSYGMFALTDYQLDVPAIVLAAAVSAGALLGLGGRSPGPVFRKTWLVAGTATAVLLLPLFWFNAKGLLARRSLDHAVENLYSRNVEAFAADSKRAHAWAPSDPLYLNQLANGLLMEWTRTEDPTNKIRLAEEARLALERSAEIAPAQDSVHFNLGIILRSQQKPEEALHAFEKALEYNPRKRFGWFLSGLALLELGREEMAAEAFARELLVNPSSLFLPLWQDPAVQPHIEARNRHFEKLAETTPISPIQRYFFFWATGSAQPFEGDLASQRDGFRVLLTAIEGDPEGALEEAPFTKEAFLVRAWLDRANTEHWLRAAFLQANGSEFSQSDIDLVAERLRKADTFAGAIRGLLQEPGLPMVLRQGRPRASGLFERNFYGAPLFDFHLYHEPIVLPLF